MPEGVAQSFNCPNYSGLLFNKGNTRTPLLTAISGRRLITDHVEFVTGQEYTTGDGEQPAISETASLTAPEPEYVTRTQKTNVTQIFQYTTGVSYGKMSNMGTLSGVNLGGQYANPQSELDFQIAAMMDKCGQDIEYTFIQGQYNKATSDATVNKTRGVDEAITSNVKAMASAPLTIWDVTELMKTMADNGAPLNDLALWCDATTLLQLNADAAQNGMTVIPASREVNGIQLSTLLTPLGTVGLYQGAYIPSGTAYLLNLGVMRPVEQYVPDHGNFFLEELAKVGAGTKYQLFGQIGLDHGPEWYHGKFTGIAATFTKPSMVQTVQVQSSEGSPVYTKAVAGG